MRYCNIIVNALPKILYLIDFLNNCIIIIDCYHQINMKQKVNSKYHMLPVTYDQLYFLSKQFMHKWTEQIELYVTSDQSPFGLLLLCILFETNFMPTSAADKMKDSFSFQQV